MADDKITVPIPFAHVVIDYSSRCLEAFHCLNAVNRNVGKRTPLKNCI